MRSSPSKRTLAQAGLIHAASTLDSPSAARRSRGEPAHGRTRSHIRAGRLEVFAELGRIIPAVLDAIDIHDRDRGELGLADILEAAEIDPVHRSDRRVVADTEPAHAAMPAEEMLVLFRVEAVL